MLRERTVPPFVIGRKFCASGLGWSEKLDFVFVLFCLFGSFCCCCCCFCFLLGTLPINTEVVQCRFYDYAAKADLSASFWSAKRKLGNHTFYIFLLMRGSGRNWTSSAGDEWDW